MRVVNEIHWSSAQADGRARLPHHFVSGFPVAVTTYAAPIPRVWGETHATWQANAARVLSQRGARR